MQRAGSIRLSRQLSTHSSFSMSADNFSVESLFWAISSASGHGIWSGIIRGRQWTVSNDVA
jgi:hypothetical protein